MFPFTYLASNGPTRLNLYILISSVMLIIVLLYYQAPGQRGGGNSRRRVVCRSTSLMTCAVTASAAVDRGTPVTSGPLVQSGTVRAQSRR